ncbi:hypothetical protein PM082_023902 [Marasmius tenuissimus]|nr:hypothetical protein PM082_023902 [Marasmius tenuissimus]
MSSLQQQAHTYQFDELPTELWTTIVSLPSRGDLQRFCLTNRFCYLVTTPLLYRKLRFKTSKALDLALPFWNQNENIDVNLPVKVPSLLTDIPLLPSVSEMVETIALRSPVFTSGDTSDYLNFYQPNLFALLHSFMRVCTLYMMSCYFPVEELRNVIPSLPSLHDVCLFDIQALSSSHRRRLIWEGDTEFIIEEDPTPPTSPATHDDAMPERGPFRSYLDDLSFHVTFKLRRVEFLELNDDSLKREGNIHIITRMLMSTGLSSVSLDLDVLKRVLAYAPRHVVDWTGAIPSRCLKEFSLVGSEFTDMQCWVEDEMQKWIISPGWALAITRILQPSDSNITTLRLCDGRSSHFGGLEYGLKLRNMHTYQGCITFLHSILDSNPSNALQHLRTHSCPASQGERGALGSLASLIPCIETFEFDVEPFYKINTEFLEKLGPEVLYLWCNLGEVHIIHMRAYREVYEDRMTRQKRVDKLESILARDTLEEWAMLCPELVLVEFSGLCFVHFERKDGEWKKERQPMWNEPWREKEERSPPRFFKRRRGLDMAYHYTRFGAGTSEQERQILECIDLT